MRFLTVLYSLISVWLAIYGLNAFVLIYLYLKHRQRREACPSLSEYPIVTVQLPLYNERYVAARAIDALASLDWPRDRLQIQVLDDSTDETMAIARRCVEGYRRQGLDITLLQRAQRSGFKAGALYEAMRSARGAFIAVFDADFCPAPDILKRTIAHLVANPKLGFVQARWGHLNDGFSLLTLAQAIALDGHFVVEHTAREGAGLVTHFSGSGGVWRRECMEGCGGWDAEMLTEDLDLSYRTQLAGWEGYTLADTVVPAEVPVQLAALKRQQFRWAKGHTQCLLKYGPTLFRAPLPLFARIQALIHLSCYLAHPLMLLVMWSTLPLTWYGLSTHWALGFLSVATLGPPLMLILGQQALYPDWWRRLKALPVVICLGTGLALNSSVAVIEAVLGIRSAFQRTPKFRIEGAGGDWQARSYALPVDHLAWGEVLLALYALLTVFVALRRGNIQGIPFLMLYVFGFGFVSILGLVQARGRGSEADGQLKAERGSASGG